MKQKTHTWIGIRAIGLMQQDPGTRGLGRLLAPWVRHCHAGCWLPDMSGFKKGHGMTQNHTFKIKPLPWTAPHFVLDQAGLTAELDQNLALAGHVAAMSSLATAWWARPYKADQPGGQHLPDCLSSLYDTILDLMLIGDDEVDRIVPGTVSYKDYLEPKVQISKEQISTFFFLISHYIADCFMPCHCDGRALAAYSNGIHKQWEQRWDRRIDNEFAKKNLKASAETDQQIIDRAAALDAKLELSFKVPVTYRKSDDIWTTAVHWCRASFALHNEIFPEATYPFGAGACAKFGKHFTDKKKLRQYDAIVLQSAVYAVAGIWKKIWRKFT